MLSVVFGNVNFSNEAPCGNALFRKQIDVAEGLRPTVSHTTMRIEHGGVTKMFIPSDKEGAALLADRVEQITKVAEPENPALFRFNVDQVQSLLSKLDYEDLTDTELSIIAEELEVAYTRKGCDGPQFLAPRLQVEYGLAHLDYEDLLHTELIAIALALAEAYGRKLLGSPVPTLRLISELAHRSAAG